MGARTAGLFEGKWTIDYVTIITLITGRLHFMFWNHVCIGTISIVAKYVTFNCIMGDYGWNTLNRLEKLIIWIDIFAYKEIGRLKNV